SHEAPRISLRRLGGPCQRAVWNAESEMRSLEVYASGVSDNLDFGEACVRGDERRAGAREIDNHRGVVLQERGAPALGLEHESDDTDWIFGGESGFYGS